MRFIVILSVVCLYFFSGCGVKEYYSLDAPSAYHTPSYETSDYTSKYFRFRTADNSSMGSSLSNLGTAVYYKIYSSSSTLLSHISAVNSVNSSSNGSAAATRIAETYGYQQLGTSSGTRTPFINGSDAQVVYIRLMNYGSEDEYSAKVTIDGVEQGWTPLRYDNRYTFDFGRSANTYSNYENNVDPESGDDDVYGSSIPSDGVWYINMYAVSVGFDSSWTKSYSLVTWLGTVAIDDDEADN